VKYILLILLFTLTSCSDISQDSRELPTKYPETATMGSAADITEELNKK